jgi:glycosyltransferase involved in cell wall biosynthesis
MRIVFVLWQGDLGGAELHTVRLAASLRSLGHWAGVVVLSRPGLAVEEMRSRSLPHYLFPCTRGRGILLHTRKLTRVLAEARPDIVVLPHNDALPILLRVLGVNGRLIAMEHGAALKWRQRRTIRRLLYRPLRVVGSRILVREIAVSQHAARNLQTLPHAPVVVVRNGIDTDVFKPGDSMGDVTRRFALGAAARCVKGKGLDTLLYAVAAALPSLGTRQVSLEIAGDGPELPRLLDLVRLLQLEDVVEFRGKVANMTAFWPRMDLMVHVPANSLESFGLTPAEAASCGCRLLLSDVPAFREVYSSCLGVTFAGIGDVDSIAHQISLSAQRGAVGALERLERHAWARDHVSIEATAREYERILEGAMDGH